MNRKKLIIIVPGIVVVIIASLFIHRATIKKFYISNGALATNISFPYIDNGKIDYFTGTRFAQFDPSTQKTKDLSSNFLLPQNGQIDSVKWSSGGVLFRATANFNDSNQTNDYLASHGFQDSTSYWWYISFSSNALEFINPGVGLSVSNAVFAPDENIVLTASNTDGSSASSQGLYIFNPTNQKVSAISTVSTNVVPVWSNGKKIIVVDSDGSGDANSSTGNLSIIDIANPSVQTVISSGASYTPASQSDSGIPTKVDWGSPNTDDVMFIKKGKNSSSLMWYNAVKGSLSTISSSFPSGFIYTTRNGVEALSQEKNSIHTFSLVAGKLSKANYTYKSTATNNVGPLTLFTGYKDGGLVYKNSSLYTFMTKQDSFNQPNYSTLNGYNGSSFSLYTSVKGENYVVLTTQPYTDTISNVDNYLVSKGIDPNQYPAQWVVGN